MFGAYGSGANPIVKGSTFPEHQRIYAGAEYDDVDIHAAGFADIEHGQRDAQLARASFAPGHH